MSIPGLGQIIPPQATTATTSTDVRHINLEPGCEWRFSVPWRDNAAPASGLKVRLVRGTAERDGTSLAINRLYTFVRTKSKIFTWHGCFLEVQGVTSDESIGWPNNNNREESYMVAWTNLHLVLLQEQRERLISRKSVSKQEQGPRVMVCGPKNTGKTTLVRTLTGLATRQGGHPLVANLDPAEGLLSLPGTVSAAVFGTVMDVEDPAGGFSVGNTPSTGPSGVPVKLPMVYYLGREKVEDDVPLWKDLASKLASSARAKIQAVDEVRFSGLILDMPAVEAGVAGMEVFAHAVAEFAINTIVVLDSAELEAELFRKFSNEKTPLGEAINVIRLDKSPGATERDKGWVKADAEAAIREYFFGGAQKTLSPVTLSVSYDELAIFRALDESESYDAEESQQQVLEPAEISSELSHWTLAVMDASVNDPLETIRLAPVLGFIAIASVDEDRRRLKFLSPVMGSLGNRPLIWGRWPEPYLNLLG